MVMDSYVYKRMSQTISDLRDLAGDDSDILLAIDTVEDAVNQSYYGSTDEEEE